MKCPICGGDAEKDTLFGAMFHCENCGYFWTPDPSGGLALDAKIMTPEGLRAAAAWGAPIPAQAEPAPAMPENVGVLDYDEREFAVCLSSRIFAKDIIRGRTSADIGRREYRCDNAMRQMIANLRDDRLARLHRICPDH